ncbi:HutD family protein [Sedimentibacter sp. zth1]|uniref:HutD family protein n=1 Tax=Sedimentibacter sp. zth1 TaxID=2816908 RepID=UPI001A9352A6|nr:HutD family protein [Sedimentibacter sp. zth1]QSX05201.1 HutD family protein [Sedimentibacter sp. zth1]
MLCDYKVIRKNDFKKDVWSGGTTTQLAIFPENELYKDRKFLWRLSSATVEQETSTFTPLPYYNRILMILDGKIELNHSDTEIINLNAFDQNEFDGANQTVSKGKVVDFNLMMRKGKCTGKVKNINVPKGSKILTNEINGFYTYDNYTLAIYNYKSDAIINIGNNIIQKLYQGDLFLVTYKEQISSLRIEFENTSEEDSEIIIAQIFY